MDRRIRSNMPRKCKPVFMDWGRKRDVWTPESKERVLDHVDMGVGVSTRQVENELNVARMTIWRVLHVHLLSPFHLQGVIKNIFEPFSHPVREGYWPAVFEGRELSSVFWSRAVVRFLV
jgi:hypothetical protein